MTTHRVHDQNGNFYLRKDGSNFYVYSEGAGPGSTPGSVRNFSYIGDPAIECSSTTAINFSWNAPLNNGGSAITGYSLRRIGVVADPSGTGSLYYGDPDTVQTGFYNPCGGGDGGSNPITIGNVTSIEIEDWSCGVYSFQIAAINANGTGNYVPADDSPSWANLNVGWTVVGSDDISISIGASSITATYPTSTGCFPNYQNTSGTLYTYQGATVSTYTGFSQGSLTFTRPATAGWYYVGNVVETWTDYSTTCTVLKAGCHPTRFYVS